MATALVRFREKNSQDEFRPGLAMDDIVADISGRYSTIAPFLKDNAGGWDPGMKAPNGAPMFRRDDVTLGPPIDPGRMIFAVGANYRQHAEEAGLGVPKTPVIFFKPYPSLVGPGEPIKRAAPCAPVTLSQPERHSASAAFVKFSSRPAT
jgi:2-keto-4-pentenoate hydratase/2-oxohepta-3-ene-1,7-dioic acid hydratase in catechol pathway